MNISENLTHSANICENLRKYVNISENDRKSFRSSSNPFPILLQSFSSPPPDDRVRNDRTSLVVQASADRPAYVYGASISIGQDIPAGGLATYPASPVTADIQGTNTELLLLGVGYNMEPINIKIGYLPLNNC